jgi:hypothetical protein
MHEVKAVDAGDGEMNCPICQATTTPSFSAKVLGKYDAQYHVCKSCGYLYAINPHWLEEAYSSAIAATDTGLVARNISVASRLASILYGLLGERGQGRYLDAAGGYGMLTRLMRDFGFDFYWTDKYCANLLARGFEYHEQMGPCHAVTAMEVLEHLTDPVTFVQDVLERSGSDTLIFTTELYEGNPPTPNAWWYYSFPTGQHIGFFQRQTLKALGDRLGLNLASANGIHILSTKKISPLKLHLMGHRRYAALAAIWARRRLGSRTIVDHETIEASLTA